MQKKNKTEKACCCQSDISVGTPKISSAIVIIVMCMAVFGLIFACYNYSREAAIAQEKLSIMTDSYNEASNQLNKWYFTYTDTSDKCSKYTRPWATIGIYSITDTLGNVWYPEK